MSQKDGKKKRDYRTGRITIKEARDRFHEYYDDDKRNYKTPLGAFRGMLADMMYTKKDRFLIKCNNTTTYDKKNDIKPGECEKGSVKYLLESGPKTFDAQHVDAFEDGQEFSLTDPTDPNKIRKFKARGHTKRIPVIDDSETEIAGPRVAGEELYKGYFRKQLLSRGKKDMTPGGHGGLKAVRTRDNPGGDGNQLVDRYWDEYQKQKDAGDIKPEYERKNKKKVVIEEKPELLLKFTIGSDDYYSADEMQFIRKPKNTDKIYKLYRKEGELLIHNGTEYLNEKADDIEYFSQIYYLQKLGILSSPPSVIKFNEDLNGVKLFNLKLKKNKRTKKILLDIILNVSTGGISYDDEVLSNKKFKKWYKEWMETSEKVPNILDFWTTYPSAKKLTSMMVEPIKVIQSGGVSYADMEYEYSSSIDDYSICSSDEE